MKKSEKDRIAKEIKEAYKNASRDDLIRVIIGTYIKYKIADEVIKEIRKATNYFDRE